MDTPQRCPKPIPHIRLMATIKKLIFMGVFYLMASMVLSVLSLELRDTGWLTHHLHWTYLVWSFLGPLSAAQYGWNGLAPIWQLLWTFLAGGLVIFPFLSMPIWFRSRIAVHLSGLGVLLWIAFAAFLLGGLNLDVQFDRLIAVAVELR